MAAGAWLTVQLLDAREQNEALRGVVAGLEIDPGWRVVSETTHEAGVLCGDITPCPNTHQVFDTGTVFTPESLAALAPGGYLTVEGTCSHPSHVRGSAIACTATGQTDGFDVSIAVRSPLPGTTHEVSITVRPALLR